MKVKTRVTCPTCHGSKKNSMTQVDFLTGKVVAEWKVDCIDCDGVGWVSAPKAKQIEAMKDAWCTCGNPSGESVYWPDNTNPKCSKHCYTCKDCDKLTQVG